MISTPSSAFPPLPLHLHDTAHALAVQHGAPCYLEKPPSMNPSEFAVMCERESQATKRTHVGFHRMADLLRATRCELGEFPKVIQALCMERNGKKGIVT